MKKSEKEIKKIFEEANKYSKDEDWEKSKDLWQELDGLIPENHGIQYNLAQCFLRLGKYKSAKEKFLMANKAAPLDINVHYGLGRTYEYERDYDQAVKAYEKCLKIDKDHTNSLVRLAATYRILKDPFSALKLYKKLNELHPKNIDIAIDMSACVYEVGHIETSISLLEGIMKKEPENKNVKKVLARIYHQIEDKKEEAIKLDKETEGEITF
tara:strand:+ start:59 stop:694 length:636 start_codon:yes stop_codon:yes gene_type:complete